MKQKLAGRMPALPGACRLRGTFSMTRQNTQ
jgi:hypothetical protein